MKSNEARFAGEKIGKQKQMIRANVYAVVKLKNQINKIILHGPRVWLIKMNGEKYPFIHVLCVYLRKKVELQNVNQIWSLMQNVYTEPNTAPYIVHCTHTHKCACIYIRSQAHYHMHTLHIHLTYFESFYWH